ncbi:MAG: hypothetical protein Q7R71_01890 [bacterium]|nr:hypothetical protein [bacterium]
MLVAAIFFILLGLVGLALPFLQGILFLAIGFVLLSLWSPKVREWMDKHTSRYPRLHAIVQKAERWVVNLIGEA